MAAHIKSLLFLQNHSAPCRYFSSHPFADIILPNKGTPCFIAGDSNHKETIMYAYQKSRQAFNRTVVVHLPEDFPTDQVEVIVLPASTYQPANPQVTPEVANATHALLTLDTSHFTVEQHKAYERACAIIKRGRQKDEPRILPSSGQAWGVFEGLIEVADDFDAPLPDEGLFWGEGTDEYGMFGHSEPCPCTTKTRLIAY